MDTLQELFAFQNLHNFEGRVTGADASADGNTLAVLTYTGVWLFETMGNGTDYFNGRISWLPISAGQCEGICFDGDKLIICSEQSRLFELSVHDLVPVGR